MFAPGRNRQLWKSLWGVAAGLWFPGQCGLLYALIFAVLRQGKVSHVPWSLSDSNRHLPGTYWRDGIEKMAGGGLERWGL